MGKEVRRDSRRQAVSEDRGLDILVVLGHRYPVVYLPGYAKQTGNRETVDFQKGVVTVDADMAEDEQIDCLIHATVHILIDLGILPKSFERKGEAPLKRLTAALLDILRANPWLTERIQS